MYGFQATLARKALRQTNGSQNGGPGGGLIRGPGTGTSDSIEDTVPAGTYIMPSDSVDKVGEEALAGMGARGFTPKTQRKGVDVRLSNGEYELPPEQVHAVGVQALDALKNATHEQVGEGLGFGPGSASEAMFFADGGLVSREGNSYSGGNVVGQISINGGAPGGTVSSIGGPVAAASPAAVPAIPETAVRILPAAAPAPGFGIIDSSAQRQQFLDRAASATEASRAARPMGSPVASVPGTPRPPGGFGSTSTMGASRRAAPGAVDQSAEDGFGFVPRGYANGGVVDEEARRRSNSFGDAAAAARDSSVTQLGAPRPAAASAGSRDLGASIPAPLPMLTPSLPPSPQAQELAGFGAPSAAGAGRGAINPPPARPAADAAAAANDASLRFSGYPLTDEQQSRVVARFDQDARDRAAGAEAARQGVPPVFGISAPAPAPAAATAPVTPAAVAPPPAAAPVPQPAPTAQLAESSVAAPGGFGPTARSGPAAGSLEDANAQAANLRAFNASVPVGGLTVINNPGPAAAQALSLIHI